MQQKRGKHATDCNGLSPTEENLKSGIFGKNQGKIGNSTKIVFGNFEIASEIIFGNSETRKKRYDWGVARGRSRWVPVGRVAVVGLVIAHRP